jgi:hypothetical protein
MSHSQFMTWIELSQGIWNYQSLRRRSDKRCKHQITGLPIQSGGTKDANHRGRNNDGGIPDHSNVCLHVNQPLISQLWPTIALHWHKNHPWPRCHSDNNGLASTFFLDYCHFRPILTSGRKTTPEINTTIRTIVFNIHMICRSDDPAMPCRWYITHQMTKCSFFSSSIRPNARWWNTSPPTKCNQNTWRNVIGTVTTTCVVACTHSDFETVCQRQTLPIIGSIPDFILSLVVSLLDPFQTVPISLWAKKFTFFSHDDIHWKEFSIERIPVFELPLLTNSPSNQNDWRLSN